MIVVAGSNLFGQWFENEVIFENFNKIVASKVNLDLCKANLISAAWSYNVFHTECMFLVSGAWQGEENVLTQLPLPDDYTEGSKLLIACNDYNIIFVNVNVGTLWILDLKFKSFKKLHFTEVPMTEKCNKSDEIVVVQSTNNTCTYLTALGNVYVGLLPSHVDTSHVIGKVCEIQCGYEHFMLLTDYGRVYTWGNGRRLQLGHGDINNLETPTEVEGLSGIKIVKIRTGGWHSMALSEFGDLYIWGWNDTGQLGIKTNFEMKKCDDVNSDFSIPNLVNIFDEDENEVQLNIKDIACGTRHSAVKLEDNSIWTTGNNKYGQLGYPIKMYPKLNYFKKAYESTGDFKLLCGPWCTIVKD